MNTRLTNLFLSAIFSLILCGQARASLTYSGSVSGIFTNPILSGNLIDVNGVNVFLDNTATAASSGAGTNAINWGRNSAALPVGTSPFSTARFVGANFTNVAPGTQFLLGYIYFTNGTSEMNSLIFGTTLTIGVTGNLSITPSTSNASIVTTSNTGISPQRDADAIFFPSLGRSFNVFEGNTAVADVFGQIVGDPTLVLTRLALDPTLNGPNAPGSIGNGASDFVPEPSSWLLLASGLAPMILLRRRIHRAD